MKRKGSMSDSEDAPICKLSCKDSLGIINFQIISNLRHMCTFTSTFPYM